MLRGLVAVVTVKETKAQAGVAQLAGHHLMH